MEPTIVGPSGEEIKGNFDIVDKDRVKFTPDDDWANCTVTVVGKKEMPDSPFLVATDYLTMALLSVRTVSVSYKNQRANTLPGFAPGTKWEDIPADWVCPVCGVGKDQFKPAE